MQKTASGMRKWLSVKMAAAFWEKVIEVLCDCFGIGWRKHSGGA
jgi:hypothetical protein